MSLIKLIHGNCGWCGVSADFYCPESDKYYELTVNEEDFKIYDKSVVSLSIKPYSVSLNRKNNLIKRIYDNAKCNQRFDIKIDDFNNNSRFVIDRCCYSVAKKNTENVTYFAKSILTFYYNIRVSQENVDTALIDFRFNIQIIERYLEKKLNEKDTKDK